MKNFKSHFQFDKEQKSGIFFLLLLIVIFQAIYYLVSNGVFTSKNNSLLHNKELQVVIDSLKNQSVKKNTYKMYPFNPNYITDYKGYKLGMSIKEIDRLHLYRETGKYVNSTEEFKKVTNVSDSLLKAISPYFKFPDWKASKFDKKITVANKSSRNINYTVKDINNATAIDLQVVSGIGEKISSRIVKFRDRLGGFVVNEQLQDVYGLDKEVLNRLLKQFKVISKPVISKININEASAYEISKLVYIKYDVAKAIVVYREENGRFTSFNDLVNIEGFTVNKIDRIKLYLSID
ncbi:competence ComEA-like helix-hairpin-helix protein [Cellulophaga sp. RHA_52]|uniref:ComEA family DNA-binding protein n=1 Tax=Cellulophaga sp. RHA_52 TaxID=1250036 RepID=UPI00119AB098|nr:helix-hairpin-helix domain-containing protein [Cellulophaga sp. RHA_52]TVZ09063.1 competence ComEA-like helix-hairpin-helix protein [Cellulophaga sp. RHA_52]